MLEVWIGTTNKGKLSEFKILFEKRSPEFAVKSLQDINFYSPPAENGTTFLENARIKARSLKAMKPGYWVLAEDSGLEVAGLGGLPGIHSARYAGPKASDSENVAKLLKMVQLRSSQNRVARFVCSLVAFSPEGQEFVTEGTLPGSIALQARGSLGFGYDPVFIPDGETKTLAELGPSVKLKISHRTKALDHFFTNSNLRP